jgi:putative hydrolase of the HAD superfamily
MRLHALTLDLDDTLWPIAPVIERADRAMYAWLGEHCPEVVAALPIPALRALRDRVFASHPELGHDFTELRLICLREALFPHGYGERDVDHAYEAFYAARNQVELYPEAGPALERLALRVPLVALSNGNACLERVGLSGLFRAQITARNFGKAKPDPQIFLAACVAAGSDPAATLHVGDHPEHDVLGALGAGLQAAWLDRAGVGWQHGGDPPLAFACLASLADYVEGL